MSKKVKKSGSLKKWSAVLTYLKDRSKTLGCIIDYYAMLERDKGYLTTDSEKAYEIALSQMQEIERLIEFMES